VLAFFWELSRSNWLESWEQGQGSLLFFLCCLHHSNWVQLLWQEARTQTGDLLRIILGNTQHHFCHILFIKITQRYPRIKRRVNIPCFLKDSRKVQAEEWRTGVIVRHLGYHISQSIASEKVFRTGDQISTLSLPGDQHLSSPES
jgi:hypothetical protein